MQTAVLLENNRPLDRKGMSKPHFDVIICDLSCKISNVAMACSYLGSQWSSGYVGIWVKQQSDGIITICGIHGSLNGDS